MLRPVCVSLLLFFLSDVVSLLLPLFLLLPPSSSLPLFLIMYRERKSPRHAGKNSA